MTRYKRLLKIEMHLIYWEWTNISRLMEHKQSLETWLGKKLGLFLIFQIDTVDPANVLPCYRKSIDQIRIRQPEDVIDQGEPARVPVGKFSKPQNRLPKGARDRARARRRR